MENQVAPRAEARTCNYRGSRGLGAAMAERAGAHVRGHGAKVFLTDTMPPP